jgi:retron-type reverse transcriptase
MNLYDKLCSYDNLFLAFRKTRKEKTNKWYVRQFERNLERNLIGLESDLRCMKYDPKPMKIFVIRDPKTRVISASVFRDRVVHHAVCNIIEPILDKSFICDSYASRKGKGTHAALKRFDYFKRRVSQNGRLLNNSKDGNMVMGYVMKCDIKHYFDTVDHSVLLSTIRRKIKDDKILLLIEKIIYNSSGKGMAIGNLSSQLFANLYLNELDYFVKYELRAKYYIRYLDDFVILHKDKKILKEWKIEIEKFLDDRLKLELHPEKSQIYPLSDGINFLGFRIFYYKLLKKSNLRLIEARIKEIKRLYAEGLVGKEEIERKIDGWQEYARYGNTYKLRRKISRQIRAIIKAK